MTELASDRIVTLRQVWADYQQTKHLKPATIRNYNQRLNCVVLLIASPPNFLLTQESK